MAVAQTVFVVLLSVLGAYIGHQVWLTFTRPSVEHMVVKQLVENEELVKHSDVFTKREIVKVTDNAYMAIGFALGNSIMLIAPEGLIIVDVTESIVAAKAILEEFRKISKKPIKALVYTHNHADHIGGAQAFIEDVNHPPDIWAHELLPNEVNKFYTASFGAKFQRSMRQFGVFVKKRLNAGIGPVVEYGTDDNSFGFVMPNKFVNKPETRATIAGLEVTIMHIPGETNDQIGVWVPSWRMMMSADDIYKAYPNIYTIRGAPARDPVDWYTSVQRIIDLKPEYLVPSHTRPVTGNENINAILVPYRDGIQYIHDQALRFINKGYVPDDVVKYVTLPKKLAMHPYLREFYGTVNWSVKGVFQLYLGWFSGDPVDLFPLSSSDKAKRMASMAGGINGLLAEAVRAWNDDDVQWALELASYVLHIDKDNTDAKKIKVQALTSLGSQQINAIARNYYLTEAREALGEITLEVNDQGRKDMIESLSMENLFHAMSTLYRPETCGTKEMHVVYAFTDTGTTLSIQLRNGVAIVRADHIPARPHVKVVTAESTLRDAMINKMTTLGSYPQTEMQIEGGLNKLKEFMNCFDKSFTD
ncbi:alkyl/aryl-sulfatase BDS1-like [Mizuhopecten yessoensis]|uniref:Alkyl/aryl-sulfatase BDS1 n=1 Tax=Mizuhopecten yessoensis TaxID=6573 RepID=A0A210QEH9_MIZYE|nr:alkyl/aryl-sulfatase BDS1-like [Mizuhopecten yessoensis]XP_021360105.1 alkyl/aryl-sulfatase BDS1-like [Mizuhopecten yessoensis]OWF47150.1 Alkyl/aryl-sulfatase BDS1 [Mizuhopecten yessoensis]